jgi:hypothetical protein
MHLVSHDQYLPVTRKYLAKCGPDAKVGDIAKAMRADGVSVGYWLNPCLIYVDYQRFGNLLVGDQVPEAIPVPMRRSTDGGTSSRLTRDR